MARRSPDRAHDHTAGANAKSLTAHIVVADEATVQSARTHVAAMLRDGYEIEQDKCSEPPHE